jgi:pimeloyl-ACP methyl ester carboxylesterase
MNVQEELLKKQYEIGKTSVFASKVDPRFSYTLYIPPSVARGEKTDLIVAVHGTSRVSFLDFRDGFSQFGKWHNCAVLCPLFPEGVLGDDERNGYKYLVESDLRYDQILVAMVEEVQAKYQQDWSRFALFGFSGGGHFTHRFAILHPQRLWAASIGASGSVTLLDSSKDWWVGIRNVKELFGVEVDFDALKRLPVHMVVGKADLETWEITHRPEGRWYMEGANDAGANRPERLARLKASFEEHGVSVQFDLLANVAHDRMKVLDKVQDFFAEVLVRRRGGEA